MPQFTHLSPPVDGTPLTRKQGQLVVPDDTKSLLGGALAPWTRGDRKLVREAIMALSGENDTPLTSVVWPRSVCRRRPVAASQVLIVPSCPAVAKD